MNLTRSWFGESCNILVFLCILLALVYVPIPLGSNRPYAWFIWQILVYGALALWTVGSLSSGRLPRIPPPVAGIVSVLLIWLALIFVQTTEMPQHVVTGLNPFVSATQQDLALISVGTPGTLSIDPGTTYNEFLKYGSYVAAFALTLVTVTTRTRLLVIVGIIIVAGIFEAIFGIYSYVTGHVVLPESGSGDDLRAGTFVNRNHFANLLTMVLGLIIGILASIINAQSAHDRLKVIRYSDFDTALFMTLIVATLIIVAGIFISGSRAPVVLFGVSFGAMLLVARSVRRPTTGEFVLAPVILVGAAAFLVIVGFDGSMIRLFDRDILGGERMLQNAYGLKLLGAVWISGVGAGNYRWTFPMFRGDDLRFVTYDYAHNDYLQAAIEQGIPVAMVLGVAILLILRELYRGYNYRENTLIRGVIFGCLLSMIFMMLHAMVEFNFRIPANAAYFFVIAAVGIAACRIGRRKRRSRVAGTGQEFANE